MICALCFMAGDPAVPAVTVINGTAVCLENHHFGAIRQGVSPDRGPLAFLFLTDPRFQSNANPEPKGQP